MSPFRPDCYGVFDKGRKEHCEGEEQSAEDVRREGLSAGNKARGAGEGFKVERMRRESSCGGELRKGLGKATVLAYDLGRGDGRRISDWKGACVPYLSCTERYGTEKRRLERH